MNEPSQRASLKDIIVAYIWESILLRSIQNLDKIGVILCNYPLIILTNLPLQNVK